MTESPERTALYRLYDAADLLLYVGITGKPKSRWTQHTADKPWWPQVKRREVEWFDSRPLAARAEVEAILAESPAYNGSIELDRHGLHREIAIALREAIHSGHILAGSQLPSENALCERFSTTRVTVRKGIALLRSEGLVVSRQGLGVFVSDPVSPTIRVPTGSAELAADSLSEQLPRELLVALTQALVAKLALR